jgi:hypothetical protein
VVLFGFSTGTKCEKLNFDSSNILNSILVPGLNPKSTTFSPLVPVQRPQEIDEKNSKNVSFGYLYRSKELIFGHKNFSKFFKLHFSKIFQKFFKLHLAPGTTFKKLFFKTMVVPGTKYGVFR